MYCTVRSTTYRTSFTVFKSKTSVPSSLRSCRVTACNASPRGNSYSLAPCSQQFLVPAFPAVADVITVIILRSTSLVPVVNIMPDHKMYVPLALAALLPLFLPPDLEQKPTTLAGDFFGFCIFYTRLPTYQLFLAFFYLACLDWMNPSSFV